METEAKFPASNAIGPVSATGVSMAGRISRGFGALSLNAGVRIVGQITIVPIALYAWGKIRYGEWLVLTGLVTFLQIADLGLQTVVVNRLCANYACGAHDQMQRQIHSALRVQLPLILTIASLCAVVLFSIPFERVLDLQTVNRLTFIAVAMMLIFELLISVPMGVVASIYRATGRLARGAVISACQQSILLVLTVSLIALNVGFVSLAALRLGVALIVAAWIIYDLRRTYPWLAVWGRSGSWQEGARMLGPGLFFLMIPLADYLSIQFTLIVVQGSLDGGEVSRLATHRTVVNMAIMVSGLLTTTVWPEFTSLHARSKTPQLIKTHRSLARMNMWLVGVVTFGMLPFVPLIYPSWTAGRLAIDGWTLAFLVTRMLLWGIWSASMTLLCAINKQKSVALALIAAAVLTSAFSVWLVPRMGISGAALAQLIGDLCVSVWLIPLLAVRETHDRLGDFIGETTIALVTGILIPVAVGFLGWRLIQHGLSRLIFLVGLVSVVGLGLMWRQLTSEEKGLSVHLLRRLINHPLLTNSN
jgi:O-antigen/teichoic acid export membrane protein